MAFDLEKEFKNHRHNGADSIQLSFEDIDVVAEPALTGKSGVTPNTGDAGTDSLISNNRTRIEEIETALQNLGLLE